MKTIKDAVIEFKGVWPEQAGDSRWFIVFTKKLDGSQTEFKVGKEQFESEAKRLGYINGYRWGVEYATNGKRPDLEDDVLVEFQHSGECWMTDKLSVECFNWGVSTAFRITDQRYKPADTSYLNALSKDQSLTHSEEGLTHSEWWDYENSKAIKLPPAGTNCEVEFANPRFGWSEVSVDYIGKDVVVVTAVADGDEVVLDSDERNFINKFRPMDHATRKAELEREKLIEAAVKIYDDKKCFSAESFASELYNAGMLVLPPKKSDTED